MRAGLLHGLGNLLPGMTGLLTAPLTARALGVEDRGVAAILLTVASLFAVAATAGLGWGARTAVAQDARSAETWARWARWVSLAALAPASLLVVWLSGAWRLSTTEVLGLVLLFGLASAAAIRSVQGNVLISLGSLAALGLSNISMAVVTAGSVGLLFLVDHLTVTTVLIVNAAGLLAQSALLIHALRKQRTRITVGAPTGRHAGVVTPSKLFMTGLAQTLDALSSRLDLLLVAIVADARTLGLYSVAAVLPQVSYFVFLTLIQRSFAKSPSLTLEERSRLLLRVCLGGGLAFAAVGGAVGWLLIEPVFGHDFGPARQFLWPAMVVTVGLGALLPTLLLWQRGGRSTLASLVSVVTVGACATAVGATAGAWWGVIVLGGGLIGLGLVHHVRQWGWRSLVREHPLAWKSVVRGVT